MSNVLRLAIVDPDDTSREALKALLLGLDLVWLEAECSRYEFFSDVIGQTHPDIGIVSLDADVDKALSLIAELQTSAPDCSIVAVSSSSDGSVILRAMRAGVKEFLNHPVGIEEMMGALERIGSLRFGGAEGKVRKSTVVAVAGATGGVGATSLAVNLGCVLAANERNTAVLVDLDLALGDADVFLDAIPDYTLVDVSQNVSRLDFALLKRSLTKHSSGLYLLPRPVHLTELEEITPDVFHRVLGLLKATFSHVIIDLSKSYSALDMVAMRAAEHILMVTQLDLPCLRNVVRLMMSLAEEEELDEKTKIVVNRAGLGSGEISLKKARETLDREIFWQLPNDYRTMVEVRNNGVPLIEQAPKSQITQSIVQLADALSGDEKPAEENKTASGWFRFFKKQGKAQAKTSETD